jgi:hypothetical protein
MTTLLARIKGESPVRAYVAGMVCGVGQVVGVSISQLRRNKAGEATQQVVNTYIGCICRIKCKPGNSRHAGVFGSRCHKHVNIFMHE